MLQIKTTSALTATFAKAVKNKDFELLNKLLDPKGEYQIQDATYKFQDATRFEFLRWIKTELELADIKKIQYKQCTGCIIGNQVVLFNEGSFAYVKDRPRDHDRAGMMLQIENDKIIGIRFCGNFGSMGLTT